MPLLFQRLKPKNRSEKRIFFMDATVKLWWICLVYLAVVTFFSAVLKNRLILEVRTKELRTVFAITVTKAK